MSRKFTYPAAAFAFVAVASGVYLYVNAAPKAPSLQEALGISQSDFAQRLYPASFTETIAGADSPMESSVRIGDDLYVTNRDLSTVDLKVRPGAKLDIISSQSYYPLLAGESGRHKYKTQLYHTLPGVAFDEVVLRRDGTLAEHTQKMDDLSERRLDYGADGKTVIGDRLIVPNQYRELHIQTEYRWRSDAGHTMEYSNVYHESEDTRTVCHYDEHGHVIKQINWPKYGIAAGSTMVEYYPVTYKLRMKAAANYYDNTADYFREDGTEEYRLTLSPGMVEVAKFDQSGKVVIEDQAFLKVSAVTDKTVTSGYQPYIIKYFDAQGKEVRELEFFGSEGYLREDDRYNLTIDGETWFRVDYQYGEDKTLQEVTYWKDKVEYPPQKKVEHKPEEKIYPDLPIPAEATVLGVPIDPDIPVPPPQTSEH